MTKAASSSSSSFPLVVDLISWKNAQHSLSALGALKGRNHVGRLSWMASVQFSNKKTRGRERKKGDSKGDVKTGSAVVLELPLRCNRHQLPGIRDWNCRASKAAGSQAKWSWNVSNGEKKKKALSLYLSWVKGMKKKQKKTKKQK